MKRPLRVDCPGVACCAGHARCSLYRSAETRWLIWSVAGASFDERENAMKVSSSWAIPAATAMILTCGAANSETESESVATFPVENVVVHLRNGTAFCENVPLHSAYVQLTRTPAKAGLVPFWDAWIKQEEIVAIEKISVPCPVDKGRIMVRT